MPGRTVCGETQPARLLAVRAVEANQALGRGILLGQRLVVLRDGRRPVVYPRAHGPGACSASCSSTKRRNRPASCEARRVSRWKFWRNRSTSSACAFTTTVILPSAIVVVPIWWAGGRKVRLRAAGAGLAVAALRPVETHSHFSRRSSSAAAADMSASRSGLMRPATTSSAATSPTLSPWRGSTASAFWARAGPRPSLSGRSIFLP